MVENKVGGKEEEKKKKETRPDDCFHPLVASAPL